MYEVMMFTTDHLEFLFHFCTITMIKDQNCSNLNPEFFFPLWIYNLWSWVGSPDNPRITVMSSETTTTRLRRRVLVLVLL